MYFRTLTVNMAHEVFIKMSSDIHEKIWEIFHYRPERYFIHDIAEITLKDYDYFGKMQDCDASNDEDCMKALIWDYAWKMTDALVNEHADCL